MTTSGNSLVLDTTYLSTFAVTPTGTQTLTNKTLTAPVITSSINSLSSALGTYQVVASDAASVILVNNTSANTITIPSNTSVPFGIGTTLTVVQVGTGQVTIQAVSSGTTSILSGGSVPYLPKTRTVFSSVNIIKIATDAWYVIGDVI